MVTLAKRAPLSLFLLATALALSPVYAGTSPIWLSGVDPVVQKDRHTDKPADYMDLFKPDSPWTVAASGVKVFKISTQMALRGSDEQLRTIIEGLKRRHIAMAIELGVLINSERCGKGTEGFGSPPAVEVVSKRIKDHGGELDYVAMDEPITWGREKKGRNKFGFNYCESSVQELVDVAATRIAILQRYFPNIRIGQIDAVNSRYPHLADDIIAFIDGLNKKIGLKVAFVHVDVAWDSDWQPMLVDLTRRLRARGVRVGVVFDGDVNAASDEQWIEQALKRYKLIMDNPKTRADDLVFQTWSPRPAKMLPETDPGAWTYALKYAVTSGR